MIQYVYIILYQSYIFSINQQIFSSIYILSKKSEILVISPVDQNIQVFEGGAGEKAGVQAGFIFQSLEGGDSTIRSGNPAGVSTDSLGNGAIYMAAYDGLFRWGPAKMHGVSLLFQRPETSQQGRIILGISEPRMTTKKRWILRQPLFQAVVFKGWWTGLLSIPVRLTTGEAYDISRLKALTKGETNYEVTFGITAWIWNDIWAVKICSPLRGFCVESGSLFSDAIYTDRFLVYGSELAGWWNFLQIRCFWNLRTWAGGWHAMDTMAPFSLAIEPPVPKESKWPMTHPVLYSAPILICVVYTSKSQSICCLSRSK